MPILVAVCGGSCSGKSTLAARVLRELGPDTACLLQFDAYYRNQGHLPREERAKVNYDHPDALDVELFIEHLDRLAAGESVDCPIYDFASHTRLHDTRPVGPAPVVIVDGILLLADERLVSRFDIRVFRQCAEEVRLDRRIERDVLERGRTEESVRTQFAATVKPMHDLFVEPSGRHADVVFEQDKIEVGPASDLVVEEIHRRLAGADAG